MHLKYLLSSYFWLLSSLYRLSVMNFRNVKSASGNTAPYRQKWCPVITPSKKIDLGIITGHVSSFLIMIFIKKKTSVLIRTHALISFLTKMIKYKHFKNRTLCLFYKIVQNILVFRQNRALCDITENCSLKNGTLTH